MPADDVKRDVSEGRMMREVPTPKDSDFRRFICSECMWNLEVRRWSKEEDAKAAFEMHDCRNYRRRNWLTSSGMGGDVCGGSGARRDGDDLSLCSRGPTQNRKRETPAWSGAVHK